MLDHPVFSDEPLPADVAGEGLLSGVQTHVAAEVRLVVELLGTDLALVRLVTRVLGKMLLKRKRDRGREMLNKFKISHVFLCLPGTRPRRGISFRTVHTCRVFLRCESFCCVASSSTDE